MPGPTLFERLAAAGTSCTALQPAPIARSRYGDAALRGANVVPFDGLAGARAGLAAALAAPGFTYLYWDGVDFTGHMAGPSSAAFDEAARGALDMIDAAIRDAPPGTRLLVTADHGQVDVDPERVDALDAVWPDLVEHLRRDGRGRPLPPAGSARDCFLHVAPGRAREVAAALADRLEDRAEVRLVDELVAEGLFGAAGPRLRARLADVCVLPAPGRMAWLAAFPGPERHFHGHHGGLNAAERDTWVGTLSRSAPSVGRRARRARERHGGRHLAPAAVRRRRDDANHAPAIGQAGADHHAVVAWGRAGHVGKSRARVGRSGGDGRARRLAIPRRATTLTPAAATV